jgi:hypothetical protein
MVLPMCLPIHFSESNTEIFIKLEMNKIPLAVSLALLLTVDVKNINKVVT